MHGRRLLLKEGCAGTPMLCEDNNSCTNDVCYEGECKHLIGDIEACALKVEIFDPPRAATIIGEESVNIVGQVFSPAGSLEAFEINGEDVSLSPSLTFVLALCPRHGLYMVLAEANDAFGRSARVVQSFTHGEAVIAPGTMSNPEPLTGNLIAWLDRDVFDDDDLSDLDDIATLVHEVLEGFDLNTLLPDPLLADADKPSFGWCTWDVGVSDITIKLESVALYPVEDGLSLRVVFSDFYAWVSATAGGACPDAIGSAESEAIIVEGSLDVSVSPGGVQVSLDALSVDIAEIELDIQEGLGQLFDWLINWFEDDLTLLVREEIEAQVTQQIAPLLSDLLDAVADFTYDFELPAIPPNTDVLPMRLVVAPSLALVTPEGMELALSGALAVSKGVSHQSPGSISGGCSAADPPGSSCLGLCGDQAPSGCSCSASCVNEGACCDDYWALCAESPYQGSGACCSSTASAGCEDNASCETCVCEDDPYCCEQSWDSVCANQAANGCSSVCGCASQCCTESPSDSAGCVVDACEACVCGIDSYCCDYKWDYICADKAADTCDGACQCSATCCSEQESQGCLAESCEACVCDNDPYCCETAWDFLCVADAEETCTEQCGCFSGQTKLSGSALDHIHPVELMAPLEFMNRLLFMIWWGGHLEINVDNAQLEETVGDLGLPGLSLSVDPHLPPTMTGCASTGEYEIQLGDVLMKASFELLGTVQSVTFFASARVAASLQLVEGEQGLQTIAVEVGEALESHAQLVATTGDSPLLDNIDNAFIETALGELFIGNYLSGVSASLPTKVIDLADFVPGLTEGAEVTFEATALKALESVLTLGGRIVDVP